VIWELFALCPTPAAAISADQQQLQVRMSYALCLHLHCVYTQATCSEAAELVLQTIMSSSLRMHSAGADSAPGPVSQASGSHPAAVSGLPLQTGVCGPSHRY
jgi:hypothetical protein